MKVPKNSLGCGKKILAGICGVADAWGKEHLCQGCEMELRKKWAKEDSNRKLKGGNN